MTKIINPILIILAPSSQPSKFCTYQMNCMDLIFLTYLVPISFKTPSVGHGYGVGENFLRRTSIVKTKVPPHKGSGGERELERGNLARLGQVSFDL